MEIYLLIVSACVNNFKTSLFYILSLLTPMVDTQVFGISLKKNIWLKLSRDTTIWLLQSVEGSFVIVTTRLDTQSQLLKGAYYRNPLIWCTFSIDRL
jgi:hypothetical protein